MMARYIHLRRHPRVFLAMTGLHVHEFDELVREIRPRYEAAETARLSQPTPKRPRRQRAIGAGHPFALDVRDQVLLLVIWLRQYPTYAVLAYLFGVSEAAVARIRARVLPVLEAAGLETMHAARERLAQLAQAHRERPPQSRRGLDDVLRDVPELVVVFDTFEQRVQRPQGRDAEGNRHADGYYSGKKKQHTLKTQVAVRRPTREILDVPESVPGPTHDLKLLEHSGALAQVPDGVGATGDLAYVGIDKVAPATVPTATPRRKPRNQPRPPADVAYNTAFARERVVVEHSIGRLRHYQAITQADRHHREHHTPRTRAIAGLANRQLRHRRQRCALCPR
jgi:DDE superfamily endonuclease/Helix-turn-helix of DDE superfamily endonuclease